jgi:DNA-binding MarR family transcriptional regulator
VWRLATKWRVAVDRAVAGHGLTHAKYSVLATLYGLRHTDPDLRPSQRRLADHTGLEPLYISKLVRALEADALVERHPDPADTRAVRLVLTDQGFAVAAETVEVVRGLLERLLAPLGGLDSARAATFSRELQLLLDNPLEGETP